MTIEEARKLQPGLYRIFWSDHSSPGLSVAAVGMESNGRVWFAPTNWVSVPCYDWCKVSRVELITTQDEEKRKWHQSRVVNAGMVEPYDGKVYTVNEGQIHQTLKAGDEVIMVEDPELRNWLQKLSDRTLHRLETVQGGGYLLLCKKP